MEITKSEGYIHSGVGSRSVSVNRQAVWQMKNMISFKNFKIL